MQGRNVVLESKYGSPKIVNDGVTVAKEVELEDPVENIGAKLVRQVGAMLTVIFMFIPQSQMLACGICMPVSVVLQVSHQSISHCTPGDRTVVDEAAYMELSLFLFVWVLVSGGQGVRSSDPACLSFLTSTQFRTPPAILHLQQGIVT